MPPNGKSYTKSFNPRTYIRYDFRVRASIVDGKRFNPRTYIRYDLVFPGILMPFMAVSIHVPI